MQREAKEICPRKIVIELPSEYDLAMLVRDIGTITVKDKNSPKLAKSFQERVIKILEGECKDYEDK